MQTKKLLAVASLFTIQSCSLFVNYTGDGQFTDRGILSGINRYRLDLGPIDLTRSNTYKFRMAGLPSDQLIVGFEVIESKPNDFLSPPPKHPANIRLRLETKDGQLVALEEARLEAWVRSHGQGDAKSFYYQRGQGRDVPLAGGGTKGERLGLKASDGWGTYFVPERSATYVLTVTIVEAELSSPQSTRLVLEGGGWMW